MIYRGTTPTLTFEFPFSVSSIEKCILSFAQNDEVLLEKNLTDFRVQNDKILTLKLTEKETLLRAEKEDRDEYMIYDFQSNSIN